MNSHFDHSQNAGTTVSRIIRVDPDELASIAQRMKIAAYDRAFPGESVSIQFAPGLTFVYTPPVEQTKSVQKTLAGGFIGNNQGALIYAHREKTTKETDPAGLETFLEYATAISSH
jgi:hypothetical protein